MKRFNNILIGFVLILFFNSNNSFSQWVQMNAPERVVRSFSLSETKIFAGTYEALYYSSDEGNSWNYAFYDISSSIYPLAINDTMIFVGSWNTGVYKSTNGCQSWTQVNNGLTYPSVKALIKNNIYIYAGTYQGVFRSSDLGTNWSEKSGGIGPWKRVWFMAETGIHLYANVKSSGNSGDNVYRSTNDGTNWDYIYYAPYNGSGDVSALAASGTYVYLAVNNIGYKNYVYYSPDFGNNRVWSIPTYGPPTDCVISSFAIKDSNVFAGTTRGVFLSQDYGDIWLPVNDGLIDTTVSALVIFKNYILAATDNYSIWKRPLSDFGITGINESPIEIPQEYYLSQNYPNPFNPNTTISFSIPKSQNVELKVFDILGNEMVTLLNEYKEAGEYKIEFNAKNLTSGIYFYQLNAGEFIQTKKMVLMK